MKKVDRMRAGILGENARESLGGSASPGAAAQAAAQAAADAAASPAEASPPLPSPDDGWTRDRASGVSLLEVARIVPDPDQPRKAFDAEDLARLAASLGQRGVLTPIRVRWRQDLGKWMLVAGECRWRAAQAAGLAAIPAIRSALELTASELLGERIAEQLLRRQWDPIEEAMAYRRKMELERWSQRELATRCHLDAGSVCRSLKLLELDGPVQDLVAAGRIVPATALELARLPAGPAQLELAQRVATHRLSTAETAAEVAQIANRGAAGGAAAAARCKFQRARSARPRIVIAIDSGKVTVAAAGDVVRNLRKAIRAYQRQHAASPTKPTEPRAPGEPFEAPPATNQETA